MRQVLVSQSLDSGFPIFLWIGVAAAALSVFAAVMAVRDTHKRRREISAMMSGISEALSKHAMLKGTPAPELPPDADTLIVSFFFKNDASEVIHVVRRGLGRILVQATSATAREIAEGIVVQACLDKGLRDKYIDYVMLRPVRRPAQPTTRKE